MLNKEMMMKYYEIEDAVLEEAKQVAFGHIGVIDHLLIGLFGDDEPTDAEFNEVIVLAQNLVTRAILDVMDEAKKETAEEQREGGVHKDSSFLFSREKHLL